MAGIGTPKLPLAGQLLLPNAQKWGRAHHENYTCATVEHHTERIVISKTILFISIHMDGIGPQTKPIQALSCSKYLKCIGVEL